MKPFESHLQELIDQEVLKQHHGVVGEYGEFRLLNKLPNGKKERDHPDFELKITRYFAQIVLADLSDDHLKASFMDTHAFEKCSDMVYIPWKRIDGHKVFADFNFITKSDWMRIMPILQTEWEIICAYIRKHGIEALKTRSSSNFAGTKYLHLFRCRDRFSESKGGMVYPCIRLKITWRTLMMLMGKYE